MEQKQNLTVRLSVRELIYDIQNKTYLTGTSRMAEGTSNFEAGAHMQASDDNEHSYQIRRSLTNAFANAKNELGEYLDETTTTTDNMVRVEIDAVDTEGIKVTVERYTPYGGVDYRYKVKVTSGTLEEGDHIMGKDLDGNDLKGEVVGADGGEPVVQFFGNPDPDVATLYAAPYLKVGFKMPSNYNGAAADALGNGLHEHLVEKATGDWFAITNKNDAADHLTMAATALENVKKALYRRKRPTRPTY